MLVQQVDWDTLQKDPLLRLNSLGMGRPLRLAVRRRAALLPRYCLVSPMDGPCLSKQMAAARSQIAPGATRLIELLHCA